MGASTFPNLPPLDSVPLELDAITQTSQRQNNQGIYPGRELRSVGAWLEVTERDLLV